jgi:hypothetical protein
MMMIPKGIEFKECLPRKTPPLWMKVADLAIESKQMNVLRKLFSPETIGKKHASKSTTG